MGEIRPLSVHDVNRITGVSLKQYKKVPWHTSTIIVKQFLNIKEYMSVVNNIIGDCKTPDGIIAYELLDFAIRTNIVSAYAFIDLPENIEDIYYTIYASDIYDTICKTANKPQIDSIINSVMLYIRKEGRNE